jgi:vanillate O-demethylase monooxygenase subunit
MYPLNVPQPYPFEQWWIAAYGPEIGRTLLTRTILGRPLVFYRTEAGEPVALDGLCPHRLYPMARGCLIGDTVQCGYHGFTYDQTGRCIRIPSQDSVPPNFAIRRYPVMERGGLVWIWTGQEGTADLARVPNLESMGPGSSDWAVEYHPPVTIRARYQLLIDNLLDLSHISFIHSTTIPGGGAVVRIPPQISDTPGSYNIERIGRQLPSNPHMRRLFPGYNGPVDHHFDAEYFGPNLIRTGGAILASAAPPSAAARPLGITNFVHGITPESPTSVHYYVMTARNFRVQDQALSAANLAMGALIQPQDMAALEAIEVNVQRFASTRRELSCTADAGAIHVRRRLATQIRAELDRHHPKMELRNPNVG